MLRTPRLRRLGFDARHVPPNSFCPPLLAKLWRRRWVYDDVYLRLMYWEWDKTYLVGDKLTEYKIEWISRVRSCCCCCCCCQSSAGNNNNLVPRHQLIVRVVVLLYDVIASSWRHFRFRSQSRDRVALKPRFHPRRAAHRGEAPNRRIALELGSRRVTRLVCSDGLV